ncbi:Separin [Galdieria sulphuraria]|nr:Separin [Galdieria sulphuraria]
MNNDNQLFQKLLKGADLKRTLQEQDDFIHSCGELFNPYYDCNPYSGDKGAPQLRLLTEKGRGFAIAAKNKLEIILKFTRQFDTLCRKDWKQEFSLTNEEYEEITCTFFSSWKRCLDILFANESLLKMKNESDLEKYSYNFIANALNRGLWVEALKECLRYLLHLFKRLGGLKNHSNKLEKILLD